MKDDKTMLLVRVAVSALVTALGVTAMVLTGGQTGCGWAILGLVVIWN